MRGWVYIIITKGIPNLVKVGFSTKDPELRAAELNNTGNPYPYEVVYDALVHDPRNIEQKTHKLLKKYHENKEWFSCSIEIAVAAIKKSCNNNILLENKSSNYRFRDNIQQQYWVSNKDGVCWMEYKDIE